MIKTELGQPFSSENKLNVNSPKTDDSSFRSESDSDIEQENLEKNIPQNQQPSITFNDTPIQMKCPFCLQNVRTEIILKPQIISVLFGFVLFVMFPHLVTLVITLIILQITSTRKHRCPLCEMELGSDGKFLVFFKDQVYSFTFGTNGIIVSKKILTSIALGIIIFILLSLKVNDAYADIKFTDLSWGKFNQQCPYDSKDSHCLQNNEGMTVMNWKGYVMRVEENRSIKNHFQYAVSIFIKMSDSSTLEINRQTPDIFLTMTSYEAHHTEKILDELSHGDQIMFNATFTYLPNSRHIPSGRHLNLVEMKQTGNRNANIHVYMSPMEDEWFFEKLSGQKLRKHEQTEPNSDANPKTQNEIQKEVQKELAKALNEQSNGEVQKGTSSDNDDSKQGEGQISV